MLLKQAIWFDPIAKDGTSFTDSIVAVIVAVFDKFPSKSLTLYCIVEVPKKSAAGVNVIFPGEFAASVILQVPLAEVSVPIKAKVVALIPGDTPLISESLLVTS